MLAIDEMVQDLAATARALSVVRSFAAVAGKSGEDEADVSLSILKLCRSAIEDEDEAAELAFILDAVASEAFEEEARRSNTV